MSHEPTNPSLGLPPSGRVVLERPQLELALAEIRFLHGTETISADVAMAIARAWSNDDREVSQVHPAQQQQLTVNLSPTGPVPDLTIASTGWTLGTADGSLLATLMPDSLSIQSTSYQYWSRSLRPELLRMLTVLGEFLRPGPVQRVGLRYVNRFVDSHALEAAAWTGRIDDAVLGPVLHPQLGASVVSTQQQVELALGGARGALLRHGAFRDGAVHGAYSYLLDIDVFDAHSASFDPGELMETATTLNRAAFQLYRQVLTETFIESMGIVRDDAGDQS